MAGPLIAIVGETGSGKSDLAMSIAKAYGGEIICADAWTIRKGMDIGTAKPSISEQQEIPHHLLNLIMPDQLFSAAQFQEQANVVIRSIHKRHKIPILVGGSGLYIDSVLYNYSFVTTDAQNQREELNNKDLSELIYLAEQEHISTEGVDRANKRRLVRLIETKGQIPAKEPLRDEDIIVGISISKDDLEQRLKLRLESMLKQGLEKEVRLLSTHYGWSTEAMKGVGYREWQEYFTGSINYQELNTRIIKDSLYLAKKQRTWFKRNKDVHWLSAPVKWQEVVDLLSTNNISAV